MEKKTEDITLEEFYDALATLHAYHFPNENFGKLISRFFGWAATQKLAFIEQTTNEQMIEYFEEYCKLYGIKHED